MPVQGPVRDIAAKLHATAMLLGCASQKELCAAFRRVNPRTDFDLERSYKWMQGRAVPRSSQVYADWESLLTLGHPPRWIATAPLEDFIAALCEQHGVAREALLAPASPVSLPAAEASASYLCGPYATFSLAQSPYYRGRIVRGSLAIEAAPRRNGGLLAAYSQSLPSGPATAQGPVLLHGRAMCLDLHTLNREDLAPVFCSLFLPSPPASLLLGMLCGTVAVHPGGQPPYATRIAMLRVPPGGAATLEESNRYLDAAPGALAAELDRLGFPSPGIADGLERLLHPEGIAGAATDQVPPEDYAALAGLCDRAWLPD